MKIGITTDVVDSTEFHRGVANSVTYLIKNIVKIGSGHDFHLIHFFRNSNEIYQLDLENIIVTPFSTPSELLTKTLTNLFRTSRLLKKFDLIHITNPFLYDFPLFFIPKIKKVLTIYDMCYFLPDRPELKDLYRTSPKTWLYHKLWKFFLPRIKNKIDLYISISDATKDDMVNYLGVPEEKIRTVHLGADEVFKPVEIDRLNESILPDEPFILTDRPYSDLITVYQELKKRGIKHKLLGFSGRDYVTEETVISLGLQEDVKFLGYVSKEELVKLYNAADLYVRLVYFTGFGIPTVEAMACGCPVVVSNSDAGPEIVGDAGILLNPRKLDEWVDNIYNVLTNEDLRVEMSKKGIERSKMYTWKKTAEETLKVYEEALRN